MTKKGKFQPPPFFTHLCIRIRIPHVHVHSKPPAMMSDTVLMFLTHQNVFVGHRTLDFNCMYFQLFYFKVLFLLRMTAGY